MCGEAVTDSYDVSQSSVTLSLTHSQHCDRDTAGNSQPQYLSTTSETSDTQSDYTLTPSISSFHSSFFSQELLCCEDSEASTTVISLPSSPYMLEFVADLISHHSCVRSLAMPNLPHLRSCFSASTCEPLPALKLYDMGTYSEHDQGLSITCETCQLSEEVKTNPLFSSESAVQVEANKYILEFINDLTLSHSCVQSQLIQETPISTYDVNPMPLPSQLTEDSTSSLSCEREQTQPTPTDCDDSQSVDQLLSNTHVLEALPPLHSCVHSLSVPKTLSCKPHTESAPTDCDDSQSVEQ